MIPALLSLLAFAAVGAAVGMLWPSWVAPPLLTILMYVLTAAVQGALPDPLVRFGGSTSLLLGLTFRKDVLAGQVGWLVVITIGAIALAAMPRQRGYQSRSMTAIAVVAAVACAGVLLGSRGDLRFATERPAFVCAGARPQVCVVADFADQLDTQHAEVTGAAHLVERLGVELPTRFEQGTAASDFKSTSVGYFSIYHLDADQGLTAEVAFENLIFKVTEAASCHPGRPNVAQLRRVIDWAGYVHSHTPLPPEVSAAQLLPRARAAMRDLRQC